MARRNLSTKIKKKLRDPIWQFVGVALAVVSLLLPLLIARFLSSSNRQIVNRLLITRETSRELTDFPEPVTKRMRIYLDDKEEKELRLHIFRIQYKGEEPVRSSDYEIPLRASIPTDRKLIGVQKPVNLEGPYRFNKDLGRVERDTKPAINFDVEVLDEHTFQIKPVLMNPGEWLGIEIYTSAKSDTSASAPIDKVKKQQIIYSEVTWSCHVAGVECPGSLLLNIDYGYNDSVLPWSLHMIIFHEGWAVYAIVALTIISLLLLIMLAKATHLRNAHPVIQIGLFSIAVASSMACAEVVSDWLYPSTISSFNEKPTITYIMFGLNLVAIFYLSIEIIELRRSKKPKFSEPPQEEK